MRINLIISEILSTIFRCETIPRNGYHQLIQSECKRIIKAARTKFNSECHITRIETAKRSENVKQ